MRIGLLCEHSDPARGGAEGYLHALAERLRDRGHEVLQEARRLRRGPRLSLLPDLRRAGAEVVLATIPAPGCELYQPHHGILSASLPPRLEALPPPLRVLRGLNPFRAARLASLRRLEEQTLAPPTRLLALSPRVVDDAARHHPGTHSVLLRPGVDLERFRPGAARTGDPVLLFVAANFRLKGLATVLSALDRLPRVRLLVVGGGRAVRHPRATYLGPVADLAPVFREAHLLVHPTWYDTAALVVLEALASGIPAVTTVRDGNADLAVEGGGAALAEPGDPAALAQAVERILAAPASPERPRTVAERFPAGAMLDKVAEVIETCAS